MGGALYAHLNEFIINNTCFIGNNNEAGGAIFLEQHKKYSYLKGVFEKVLGRKNEGTINGDFLALSAGILSSYISFFLSTFEGNYGGACNIYF